MLPDAQVVEMTKFVFSCLCVLYAILCIGCSDYEEKLSGGYSYLAEARDDRAIVSNAESGKDIYPEVLDYAYNDDFIIAVQRPNYDLYKGFIAFDMDKDSSLASDIDRQLLIADSVLAHDPFYVEVFSHNINYWIISHKSKERYGPLSFEQYLQTRRTLGIPETLIVDTGSAH